jgi:hypothetical protein
VVQIRDHGPLKVVDQRGQHFSEGDGARWVAILSKVPFGLVQNGVATLFATHLKDVAEFGIHCVALDFGQGQPGGKQIVMPGLGHGGKVELGKHCAHRKIAGQQRVGHVPEKVFG